MTVLQRTHRLEVDGFLYSSPQMGQMEKTMSGGLEVLWVDPWAAWDADLRAVSAT